MMRRMMRSHLPLGTAAPTGGEDVPPALLSRPVDPVHLEATGHRSEVTDR